MKRLLALLTICLPIYLFAQGFGSFSHDQPFFAKDNVAQSTAPLPSGINFRWEDLNLSQTTITSWTDSYQGIIASNTAPNSPVRDANGLYFNGTKNLITQNTVPYGGGCSIYMIYQADSASAPAWGTLFGVAPNAWGLMLQNNQTIFSARGSGFDEQYTSAMARDVLVDVVMADTKLYTNGVLSSTIPSRGHNFSVIGADGQVGGGNAFKGYIRAILVWTNTVLTASDALTLHQYRTNTYGP